MIPICRHTLARLPCVPPALKCLPHARLTIHRRPPGCQQTQLHRSGRHSCQRQQQQLEVRSGALAFEVRPSGISS
eukprot:1152826-Pelagomonas_calceolata.AAC.10